MKYKVGDKVRIIDEMGPHLFMAGDEVEVCGISMWNNDLHCFKEGRSAGYGYVNPERVELVERKKKGDPVFSRTDSVYDDEGKYKMPESKRTSYLMGFDLRDGFMDQLEEQHKQSMKELEEGIFGGRGPKDWIHDERPMMPNSQMKEFFDDMGAGYSNQGCMYDMRSNKIVGGKFNGMTLKEWLLVKDPEADAKVEEQIKEIDENYNAMHRDVEKELLYGPPKASDKQVGGDHYKKYKIQPAFFCHQNGLDGFQFNIIKYACRFRDKGGVKDLDKIIHYIHLLKEFEYNT